MLCPSLVAEIRESRLRARAADVAAHVRADESAGGLAAQEAAVRLGHDAAVQQHTVRLMIRRNAPKQTAPLA